MYAVGIKISKFPYILIFKSIKSDIILLNKYNMEWSKEIKQLREYLCLSQTEFAQLLGVSFVSVNRWENGHFEPTIKAKRKIKILIEQYNKVKRR